MTKILFFRKKLSRAGFFCQRVILKSYEEHKDSKTKELFKNYLLNSRRLDTVSFVKTIYHSRIQMISFKH